jgi:hypothetical protein
LGGGFFFGWGGERTAVAAAIAVARAGGARARGRGQQTGRTHQVDDALAEEAGGEVRRGPRLLPHLFAQVRELALWWFGFWGFERGRWNVRETPRSSGGDGRRWRRSREVVFTLTACTTTAPARRPGPPVRTGAATASLRAPRAEAPAPVAAATGAKREEEEEEGGEVAPAAPRQPAARPEQPSIALLVRPEGVRVKGAPVEGALWRSRRQERERERRPIARGMCVRVCLSRACACLWASCGSRVGECAIEGVCVSDRGRRERKKKGVAAPRARLSSAAPPPLARRRVDDVDARSPPSKHRAPPIHRSKRC